MSKKSSYGEELAVIKVQLEQNFKEHKEIKEVVLSMDKKLDTVIESKADKKEVDSINNRLWGLLIFFLTTILSVVGYLLINMKR